MKLTLVIIKADEGGYIGQLKELPSVISQGETEEELMENIQDALDLYLEDMRNDFPKKEQNSVSEREIVYMAAQK